MNLRALGIGVGAHSTFALRLQIVLQFLGIAIFIDIQNRADQAHHSDSSDLDVKIRFSFVIWAFISR